MKSEEKGKAVREAFPEDAARQMAKEIRAETNFENWFDISMSMAKWAWSKRAIVNAYAYEALAKELEETKANAQEDLEIMQNQALEIGRLAKDLAIAREALEFYADPEKWINRKAQFWERTCPKSKGDEEMILGYKHPTTDWSGTVVVGGKTARKALKQTETKGEA